MLLLILGVIFVILKLTGAIAWSWWWVSSPFILFLVYSFIVSAIVTANGMSQGKTQEEILQDFLKFGKQ